MWRKVVTVEYPEAKVAVVSKADILPAGSQKGKINIKAGNFSQGTG